MGRLTVVPDRVVRIWRVDGTPAGVRRYCQDHFPTAVLPRLRARDGFLEANVLVRAIGDKSEVVVVTVWESIDAVRAFAGDRYERAVVEPVVRDLLDRVDDSVSHFTIAVAHREPQS